MSYKHNKVHFYYENANEKVLVEQEQNDIIYRSYEHFRPII